VSGLSDDDDAEDRPPAATDVVLPVDADAPAATLNRLLLIAREVEATG